MARYVTIQSPIDLLDPSSDEPIKVNDKNVSVTFADFARGLLLDPRVAEQLDTFAILDLRRKLSRARVGDVVEISDEEQQVLSDIIRKKPNLSAPMIVSGEDYFRAIVDAPAKLPTPKEEKADA